MARFIKGINIALRDLNGDGTPESALVTYEIRDSDDNTMRSNGRFEYSLNPFDTAIAINHSVREMIGLRENIEITSSSSSTTP